MWCLSQDSFSRYLLRFLSWSFQDSTQIIYLSKFLAPAILLISSYDSRWDYVLGVLSKNQNQKVHPRALIQFIPYVLVRVPFYILYTDNQFLLPLGFTARLKFTYMKSGFVLLFRSSEIPLASLQSFLPDNILTTSFRSSFNGFYILYRFRILHVLLMLWHIPKIYSGATRITS